MAIGLVPKYRETYSLAGLTGPQFLILAIEAAASLNWRLHYLSAAGFIATTFPRVAQVSLRIEGDKASLHSSSIAQELWDRGRNKANIDQLIKAVHELKGRIPPEQLNARFEEISPMLPHPEADALRHPPVKARSAAADILAIFKPIEDYAVTPVILNLNLLVYLLMAIAGVHLMEPAGPDLLAWGANYEPLTLGGQWWRLLTACFVHIGAIHLLLNMYAFLLIGAQLEPRLGKARFLAAYLLSGIAASATSLWWHDHNSVSAGASGAIFGMYGVFLVMLNANLVEKTRRKQLLASILFFVVYNLLGGLKEGIDNAAHIGGLVSGMIISMLFIPGLRSTRPGMKNGKADSIQDSLPPASKEENYYP